MWEKDKIASGYVNYLQGPHAWRGTTLICICRCWVRNWKTPHESPAPNQPDIFWQVAGFCSICQVFKNPDEAGLLGCSRDMVSKFRRNRCMASCREAWFVASRRIWGPGTLDFEGLKGYCQSTIRHPSKFQYCITWSMREQPWIRRPLVRKWNLVLVRIYVVL